MDRTELEGALKPFAAKSKEKGYPLSKYCLEEAFPGDVSSSFKLYVKADWIDEMDCSGALDKLIDTLWESVGPEIRSHIFGIFLQDSDDELRCSSLKVESSQALSQ